MATLTLAHLRRLVRLQRQEVDGAAEQLDALIDTDAEALAALLDVPGADVDVLRESEHRVALLGQWIENAQRHHAEHRARLDRRLAERLAEELVAGPGYGSEVVLDPVRLAELVGCRSYDWLLFDPDVPQGLERKRLLAILRSLQRTTSTDAVLWPHRLHLAYTTPHSRGRFNLAFQPIPLRAELLYVPAFESVSMRAAEPVTPPPRASASIPPAQSPEPEATGSDTLAARHAAPTRQTPGRRTPTVTPLPPERHGVLRRLLEFASEALR